jgi:hypothetical protein
MSKVVCTTVEKQVLVPGTGVFVPTSGEDWNALAVTQLDPVEPYGNWRYEFDPVQGSVFVTGIFDSVENPEPRPDRYIVAVEFEIDKYRVRYNGEKTPWTTWSNERLALQHSGDRFRLFADGTEIWAS